MTEPTGTGTPEPSGDPSPPRAWLTRNLLVLSAVSFLQDTASELVYPILPTFITIVLGAPAAVLGSIEGLADGISAIVSPFAGRAADRIGRKPLITAGYGLGRLASCSLRWPRRGPPSSSPGLPTASARDCADHRGARSIADGVVPAQRGKAFGFHRAMDTFGAVPGAADRARRVPGPRSPDPPTVVDRRGSRLVQRRTGGTCARSEAGACEGAVPRAAEEPTPRPARSGHPAPLPPAFRRVVAVLTIFSLVNFPDALVVAPAALDRVLRGHDDPCVCDLQHRLRDVQRPRQGSAERPALASGGSTRSGSPFSVSGTSVSD